MALEAQVANNAFARPAPASTGTGPAPLSPERLEELTGVVCQSMLCQAIYQLTDASPDRWQLQEAATDIIQDTLSAFPDDSLPDHFRRICQALNLEPDLTNLSDHLKGEMAAPPDRYPEHPS